MTLSAMVVENYVQYGKNGPKIRIIPYELHVSDHTFVDTIYTRSAPRDKYSFMTAQFGERLSTFSTDSHHHHRMRRAAINPFFSKQRVMGLQGMIWTQVERLCTRFEEFAASSKPIPTGEAFSCLTADIIIKCSLGVEQKALDNPDFAPYFTQALKTFTALSVVTRHMPSLHIIIDAMPQKSVAKINPKFAAMLDFRRLNDQRVQEVFARNEKAKQQLGDLHNKTTDRHTVFDDLRNSDMPPDEKTLHQLSQEN
ncbi:hypothetical protein G6011_09908 [Alternaria panax]|uniref:Cytochrome P450 n=1 Tax=Alternaria panax TaxID=48097 RepID=A0AAD4FCE0_9PLEO|nr:hypothetical protein G6011_09908 [Alternaria panax]